MSGFHPELFFVFDGVSPAGSGAVCQWHTSSTDRSGSVDRVRTVPTGDLPPGARSRGAAPHPAAFEKGKTSRSEVYETFPIFSRHLRAAVFLLLLTFISSVAHSLEEHGIDMDEFIAMAVQDALHPKIPEVEGKEMENMRTLAFQAPESLFQRVKRYLERNQMTQKAEEEQDEAPVNK